MTTLRKILWNKKQDPQFKDFLEVEKAKSNALGIQGLSFGLILIFLLPCLGLDLVKNSLLPWKDGVEKQLIIIHFTGLVFNIISYLVAGKILKQLNVKDVSKKVQKKLSLFSVAYAYIVVVLGIVLSITDKTDSYHLLFYIVAVNLVVAFIHLEQKISLLILLPTMLVAWVLNFLTGPPPGVLISFLVWSSAIIAGAYVTNSFLYNNFIQRVLQKEVIRLQNLSLLQSNEAKDRILGMVAHDLRTPVANVDQILELASDPTTTAAEQKEYFSLIRQSCNQAYTIIKDILDVSGSSKTEIQKVPTDLNMLVEKVLKVHSFTISQKQLNFQFKKQEASVVAEVDPSKMERVVDNLVTNAIKFTDVSGKVEVFCYYVDSLIKIKIKDSGIGIPEKMLPYIFEPFSKARRKGLNGEKTVGLGLSIVKSIVEQHNGTISVHSLDRKGTTFEISIPRH